MKNFLILGMLIAVLHTCAFAAGQRDPVRHGHEHMDHRHHEADAGAPLSGKVKDEVRIVEVKASRYKFEPDPIVIKMGEKVRLVVTSVDVSHGIAISDFNVNLAVPAKGTKEVEFTADKPGTFHAHCSVYCGSGHGRMHGSLIVRK